MVALLLVAWWWCGVVASPRGIMLMWWWGCGGVLCAVGMWEVLWGGVGLAPVLPCSSHPHPSLLILLPWSSPPPAVVGLLLIPVLLCSCAPVLLWGGISPPSP